MTAKGRIGVIIPMVTDTLNSELLGGIYDQAKKLGYDVLVFTNATNSMREFPLTDYVKGEENIFSLAETAELDGVLLAAGCFFNPELVERIMDRLEKLTIPCLVLELMQERFPYIYPSQREGIRRITRHLIEDHGCRRLHCLTGIKGSIEAEERLEAFLEIMAEYGSPTDESTYTYGDFWKISAQQMAERIANGEMERPEGIVCASDNMALSLCDALKKHGIRVPEDIRVTGYDGSMNASLHEPVLSTVSGKDEFLGQAAVMKLHEMMGGSAADAEITAEITVKYGTSCGCSAEKAAESHQLNINEYMERDFLYNCTYREYYMTSNFIGQMSDSASLTNFAEIVDSLAYLLPTWKRLDICLCVDWLGNFKKFNEYRTLGHSEKMLNLLSKTRDSRSLEQYSFKTRDLLPALKKPHAPEYIVFMPIHSQNHIYGYAAFSYENGRSFVLEERLHNWCDAVANGLRSLRQKLYVDYMKEKMERYSVRDPISGLFNRKGLIRNYPEFAAAAKEKGKAVHMMLVSWNRTIVSSSDNEPDDGTLMANVIQMACKPEEFAARISEKMFVILQPAGAESDVKTRTDKKILQLIHMLKSIQGQTSVQMPELITEAVIIPDESCFENVLSECTDRLTGILDSAKAGKTDYSAQLSRIRLEMRMLPGFEWNADDMAYELGVSKSYFQKLYRAQFGTSFMDDIITARLDKAKELLDTTNLRLQEIGEQCGYQNQSHFMRQFKARTGMTAQQYRNRK